MSSTFYNSIGLLLDIIGGILLYFFGISPRIDRDGAIYIVTEGKDESEILKAKKYDRLSKIALILIIIGFGLQLISNHI